MSKISHLMCALDHLNQVHGLELVKRSITFEIKSILAKHTCDLEGTALIDRLSDDELIAAIAVKEPRLKIYEQGFIDPAHLNYVRQNRPSVAAIAFSKPY